MRKWAMPFPEKRVTGHFGKIRTFKGAPTNPHRGTDWSLKNGEKIPAITDGKIMVVQFSKVLGWVLVQSAKDSSGKIFYIGYCHLKDKPVLEKGTVVKCGETIALGGNTGSASSGPHLHATLSDSIKGVFYGNVFDLFKKIKEEGGEFTAPVKGKAAKAAKAAPAAKATTPAPAAKQVAPTPAPAATPAVAPATEKTYTVVPGDTLGSIASRFGTTITEIAQLNKINNVNLILVGQILRLP
jgi:murein DD-endopeptidase MepM/ murein hydrolase activator NlpD